MLLYTVHEVRALPFHHVEGNALLPKAARSPNAVQVGLKIQLFLLINREAEVHHYGDLCHINP